MTLTDKSEGTSTVADFYAAWNRLRGRLTRARKGGPYMTSFAAVMEVQERGALHLHVVMTGRYIPQRQLSEMAVTAGFGRCTDIREVKRAASESARNSAKYVTKQLGGYLTKQSANELAAKTNRRLRPLRTSRNWPLKFEDALRQQAAEWREAAGHEVDEGPFAFVQRVPGGDLLVRLDGVWSRHPVFEPLSSQDGAGDARAEPPRGGARAERATGCASERRGA